jgi:cation channel sperm-associated protein 4
MVVKTVLNSIPDMANIMTLLVLLMFVWAVLGVTLFGESVPDLFGSLGKGTLFDVKS